MEAEVEKETPDPKPSPSEPLLQEIHIPLRLPPPHRPPDIVRQPRGPAHTHRHGPHPRPRLHRHQRVHVRFPREHLHRRARAVDLLGAPGPRHEQLDAQHVAPARHGEDGRHPGPDPLEVLGRADDPGQEDAAGRDGAGGVTREEVAHDGHLARYADAAGDEHDGAVGVEVRAAVGAFDEGGEGDAVGGGREGFAVEVVGEAGAAADDQGDGGLGEGEGVGRWRGGFGSLFEVAGVEVVGWGVGPGDGKGVGSPEADGGYGEEDVLAWFEGAGAGETEGDAEGVAGEDLDVGGRAAVADVAVDEGGEADETFDDPD